MLGVLDSVVVPGGYASSLSSSEPKWEKRENEPISVLDTRRSPSPSTSTSTLSAPENGLLPPPEPLPVPADFAVAGAEDWEALLSDSGQDQFLLRWISNEIDAYIPGNQIDAIVNPSPSLSLPQNPNPQIPNLATNSLNFPIYPPEALEEKPQIFNQFPNLPPIPPPLLPLQDPVSLLHHQPPLKRPNLGSSGNYDTHPQVPNFDKNHPSPSQIPNLIPQQIVYDQLYKASELILAGNFSNAQSILARLNHQLLSSGSGSNPNPSPSQRAAFYFKEALQLPLTYASSAIPMPCKNPTPIDGLFKMGAYKLLSEVSPMIQFINFTSNQAILEAVWESDRVHVIDFDIGSGAQWASFIAELLFWPRRTNRGSPSLKITAFASPSTHTPFELGLMHENLTQLANDINVNFELEVVNLDAFDPGSYPVPLFKSNDNETLVVNFPIWAFSNRLSSLPSILRFVKQLSPKIIVSMECGCERIDLPFSHHLLHALQYYEALLESIYAANMSIDTVTKIEKFVIQPQIENIVMGRLNYPDQMPHWRALFAAAGFLPVNLSNFAEAQAECVLKKTNLRGFGIEKRQGSLVLSWHRRELVCASVWKC